MRMLVYAVSAACGCAPVGYNYYQRTYYQPAAYVEPAGCGYDPCGRSASEWGGESAYPTGYSYGYQPYYSPYWIGGSAYNSYGYHRPRVRVGVQVEARNHHHPVPTTAIAQVRHPKPKTEVAAVPLPKADPRKKKVAHHFPYPAKMVAVETQD